MQLLTTMTSTVDDHTQVMLSAGGLVDGVTACGDEVTLWTDAESLACIELAAAARQLSSAERVRVA